MQLDIAVDAEPPVLYVLIADDAPAGDAATLRADLGKQLGDVLAKNFAERWSGSCGNPDPAAWHPGDLRVALARASAPDAALLLTPIAMPTLEIQTQMLIPALAEDLAAAVAQALEMRLAEPGEMFRPIHAAERTLDLMAGRRAPATPEEIDFYASLPDDYVLELRVLGTRDDAGTDPVGEITLDPGWTWAHMTEIFVVGPESDAIGAAPSRLSRWAGENRFRPWLGAGTQLLGGDLIQDCAPRCMAHDIATDPDGFAHCRVTIDQPDREKCDLGRGWRDPTAGPQYVEGGLLRRCDVVQLTGPSLDACRMSLACQDCPSGWCKSEVEQLVEPRDCSSALHRFSLRFVGGSRVAPAGVVHITCQIAPPGL